MFFRSEFKYALLSFLVFVFAGWLMVFGQQKNALPEGHIAMESATHKKGAEVIHKVNPLYPVEAKRKGIEGLVKIEVTVDKKGEVTNAKVLSGPQELRESALTAVRQWRYKPLDTEFKLTVDINYTLAKDKPKA